MEKVMDLFFGEWKYYILLKNNVKNKFKDIIKY